MILQLIFITSTAMSRCLDLYLGKYFALNNFHCMRTFDGGFFEWKSINIYEMFVLQFPRHLLTRMLSLSKQSPRARAYSTPRKSVTFFGITFSYFHESSFKSCIDWKLFPRSDNFRFEYRKKSQGDKSDECGSHKFGNHCDDAKFTVMIFPQFRQFLTIFSCFIAVKRNSLLILCSSETNSMV